MKKKVKKALNKFGYYLVKLPQIKVSINHYSELSEVKKDILDIEALSQMSV